MRPRATNLGPGWSLGEDGLFWRRAARVLLVDEQNRLLLVRGHDVDQPERTWWFTIGGGIDPGESAREAAVRELREESGLAVRAADLVGPVLTRSAIFDFQREHVRQDEEFFLARIERPGAVRTDGWTAVERSFMDEARWWDLAELARVMEHHQSPVATYILFIQPEGTDEDWSDTGLWRKAQQIPGVTVMKDKLAAESQRFLAGTSGTTLLYNAQGELLFSGGITSSRGHYGANAASDQLLALLREAPVEQVQHTTAVFGCPLNGPTSECREVTP